MLRSMIALLSLLIGACTASAWSHGAAFVYVGPCDLITCAEAYSVTRAMKASYAGPLFQLYNGSTTLDIGQTAAHVADMTTWSAFCSGVQSNCVIGKIYGQINSNTLVPSTVDPPFHNPTCNGGTNYKCAAPFTIENSTGLPIIKTTTGQEYYNGNGTLGADDTAVTGITSGQNPLSIVYNGFPLQVNACCGSIGMAHKYNAGDTIGTDLMVMLNYGTGSGFPETDCSTASTFCAGIEEETDGNTTDYGSAAKNIIVSVTFNGNNTVTARENGKALFSTSPGAATLNPGAFLHFGGGGDLGQPAPTNMREALFTNSALSSANQAAIERNMQQFYIDTNFP
jgi:hypothetical protein